MIGKYAQALKEFESCLAINPDDDAVNFALSELNAYKEDMTSAIQFGERAHELDEDNKWYTLNLALLYQKSGDYKNAAIAYEKALEDKDADPNLWFAYSDALVYSKDYQGAIDAYNKIEEKMGVIPEISLRKHTLYSELGKEKEAVEELEKLIQSNPKDAQFHGTLAEYYMRKGNDEKAKEILDKMLEMDPTNGTTHLSLTDYYSKRGVLSGIKLHLLKAFESEDLELETKMKIILDNYERIEKPGDLGKEFNYKLINALVNAHPDEAKVYAVYADYDQIYRNLRNARDMYLKAIELDNTRYPIWNQMLLLTANLADYEVLYEKGKEATELFQAQPMMYVLAGMGAVQMDKTEDGIELLTQGKNYILDEKLMEAEFNFQLGQAYYKEKNYDEAFESYEKAIATDSLNALFLNNYAYNLAKVKKDLDKAETMVLKAKEIYPDNPSYMDTFGWIKFQKGEIDLALVWLGKALGSAANDPDVNEHFGDALFKKGNQAEALRYWNFAKDFGGQSDILMKKIKTGTYHE
jgi:tetratricopeptide (TPR) repeat protein